MPATCIRVPPLKPKSIVTTAPFGSLGTTGAAAGRVPFVITSGSYTHSFPVAGSKIVACTKAPRFAAFAMVQPEAAGDAPPGPVSRYGVASPIAVNGCWGTMIAQFTFAVGVADGHCAVPGVASPPDALQASSMPSAFFAVRTPCSPPLAWTPSAIIAGRGLPAFVEAVSMALMCGALRVPIPAMAATSAAARITPVGTRPGRDRTGKFRVCRASRL